MEHKNIIFLALFTFLLVFALSCTKTTLQTQITPPPQPQNAALPTQPNPPPSENITNQTLTPPLSPSSPLEQNTSCKLNTDCPQDQYCISKSCTSLQQIYNNQCSQTCTLKEVTITTSDKKTYTLNPGKGDYTAAGSIEWTILRTPSFCENQSNLQVPFKIYKHNYDQVLGDETILLKEGQTSNIITHPLIKDVKFTITLNKITLNCS